MAALRPGDVVDVLVDKDAAAGGERTVEVEIGAAGLSDASLDAFLELRKLIAEGSSAKRGADLKRLCAWQWNNLP
jgi:hypothetical protein